MEQGEIRRRIRPAATSLGTVWKAAFFRKRGREMEESGHIVASRRFHGHSGAVLCLGATADELFSGSADHSIAVWDPLRGDLKTQLNTHDAWVHSICVSGGMLCSADSSYVSISNANTCDVLRNIDAPEGVKITCVCILGDIVYMGTDQFSILRWCVRQDKEARHSHGRVRSSEVSE